MIYNDTNLKLAIEDLQKKIDRGVKFLDKKVGRKKWVSRIKPQMLDMAGGKKCICGFVFGDYFDLINGEITVIPKDVKNNPEKYGFYINDDYEGLSENMCYDILGHLWIDTIKGFKK